MIPFMYRFIIRTVLVLVLLDSLLLTVVAFTTSSIPHIGHPYRYLYHHDTQQHHHQHQYQLLSSVIILYNTWNGKRIKPLPYRYKNSDPIDIEKSILQTRVNHNSNNSKKMERKNNNNNNQMKYQYMIGVDESGTGCIAGPIIVVSCTILFDTMNDKCNNNNINQYIPIPNVNDCKSLSASDCSNIYQHVQNHPNLYVYNVQMIYPCDIDQQHDLETSTTNNNNNTKATVPQLIQHAMAKSIETLIDEHLIHRINKSEPIIFDAAGPMNTKLPIQKHEQQQLQSLPIYCILDGHMTLSTKFFHKYNIPCRPYKNGDLYVYTIALASCIARHLHEIYMKQILHVQYKQYNFHIHGGYSTQLHLQSIYQYGILYNPKHSIHIHRLSCLPIKKLLSTIIGKTNNNNNNNKYTATTNTTPNDKDKKSYIENAIFHDDDTIQPQVSTTSAIKTNTINRKRFLTSIALLTSGIIIASSFRSTTLPSYAMYIDNTNGILYPNIGEIENSIPKDWTQIDNPFLDTGTSSSTSSSSSLSSYFTRLDTTSDTIFYNEPRFVEHIDPSTVQILQEYIDTILFDTILFDTNNHRERPITSCLDLCSSWTSHISESKMKTSSSSIKRMVGLGMNEKELQANPILTQYIVQDLNNNPKLPFDDNTFDVILCQLSIDYLIQPFSVCQEIARILTSDIGTVYIFFSNRSFISKAVAIWTGKDDIDHTFLVASYLYYCNTMNNNNNGNNKVLFNNIQAHDLSKRTKSGRVIGDPLYVVSATKA